MRKDLEANMRAAGFEPHDVDGYRKWRNRQNKKRFHEKDNENNDRGSGSVHTTLSVETPTSLFPESKNLTLAAHARGIEGATLTNPFLEYAREWTTWDDRKIARQFELCRSTAMNRAAGLPRSLWAYWQAWCQRGQEREEARTPLGSLDDRCQKSAQSIAVMNEAARRNANGTMLNANGSGVRGQVISFLSNAARSGPDGVPSILGQPLHAPRDGRGAVGGGAGNNEIQEEANNRPYGRTPRQAG